MFKFKIKMYLCFMLFVVNSFVLLHLTTLFGFISATINTTMMPSYANIVDITLVLLQITIIFGFICATINIAMAPNNANIMLIYHVFLKIALPR